MLLYQIGLKLFIGTVLTSRQIRWSPNFSCTIASDAIRKWGALPHCIKIWGHPPSPPHSLFHPCLWVTKSEGVGLIVPAISFQDFQPVRSWSTNVTDRQTDGRHAISIPRYALVHRAVKIAGEDCLNKNILSSRRNRGTALQCNNVCCS